VLVFVGDLSGRLEDGLEALENYDADQLFQTTRIYDRHGNLLHEVYGEGRRTLVELSDISQHLIDATIATEDNTFWDNPGVDFQSIVRAGLEWISTGEFVTGASTITQQVVDQTVFSFDYASERSLQRKLEEAILAMMLNDRKSKSEILELYLNISNYSNQAYGVEAAAQLYFGKSAKDLTLAEATLIAGIPQAPGIYDPLSPDEEVRLEVKARQRVVLDLMVQHGYLTQEVADAAYREQLVLKNHNRPEQAPHFTLYAESELDQLLTTIGLDPALRQSGGLEVYTTVDVSYQATVEKVARDHVAALREAHNMTNAAVVVIHPPTGEILAMLGSLDYEDESIDGQVNVALMPRQPGSSIKPLTYATALEQGFTPAHLLWDTPTEIGTGGQLYIPVNYDGGYHGPVRMRTALANSYNIPAVQMLRQVGIENVLTVARRLGIVSTLSEDATHYGLSLTLGGGEVTLLELTRAYTVFANDGYLVPTVSVLCVLDNNGNMLYQYENRCPRGQGTSETVNAVAQRYAVLDPRIAFVISDILGDNAARTPAMGADSPLNTGDLPASAKTGTSNDFKDNLTVGFTRNLAVGVWTGNSDSSAMIDISGLQGAAPIWHDVMLGVYSNPDLLAVLAQDGQLMPDYRSSPSGLVRREVCAVSSLQDPATECPRTEIEWFLEGPAAVPNEQGELVAPQPTQTSPQQQPDGPNEPQITDVGDGIWVATVIEVPPEVQAAYVPEPTGNVSPPAPRYCIVPASWNERPEVQPNLKQLWFIEPPPEPEDATRARLWAEERNIPVLPYIVCDDALLTQVSTPNQEGLEATWYITSPRSGDTFNVGDVVPIIGTAQFSHDEVQFYKLEIGQKVESSDAWRSMTFGSTHDQPVVNGQLEELNIGGPITPGEWVVCLELVKLDGNFPMPYCVTITVEL
jgi:penicillin-binding protein 1C